MCLLLDVRVPSLSISASPLGDDLAGQIGLRSKGEAVTFAMAFPRPQMQAGSA